MRTPLINTGGRSVSPESLRNGNTIVSEARVSDLQDVLTGKGMIALVPDDIFEAFTDDELEGVISRTFGYSIQRRLRFGEDEEGDKRILHELANMPKGNAATNFLIRPGRMATAHQREPALYPRPEEGFRGDLNDLGGSHRSAQTGCCLHPGERGRVGGHGIRD